MAPSSADLKRFCRKQVAEIIQRAGVEFGIDGAPIAIDETRLPIDDYPNIWEAIRAGVVPDLDRFWNLLRETYEADGPAKAVWQTAATLVRAFGVASSSAVRRSTVFVRLKLVAISQTVSYASRPSRQLHFGSYGACYAGIRSTRGLCASQWTSGPGQLLRAAPSRRCV
ncbi:hypothetical protein [Cupriavidus sp. Agwp_2]|uniref:hypothetical protein n=1 Tax=Cupriavidus sp. Agwp_2 TaxID=2897324 RepID=UPI0034617B14